MKTGKTIQQLAKEIKSIADSRHDYRVPTDKLTMEAEQIEVQGVGMFTPNDRFHDQMAGHLKIGRDYYKRMRTEAPELLATNVNHWLHNNGVENRMVRTLGTTARAFLSERYRPIDNDIIASAVLPVLYKMGDVEIVSAEVTESRMYIQFVTPKLQGEVKRGDIVQAGGVIQNSEVGVGSFNIQDLLYRLVCLNGMVTAEAMRRKHIGRAVAGDLDEATEYYSAETQKLDDRALMGKVSDTVRSFFNKDRFERVLETARRGAKRLIEADPVKVVEEVTKKFNLSEEEGGFVLTNLIKGKDLSQWGMTNAVTSLANTVPSYDRAVELEKVGGQILDLNDAAWGSIAA